MPRDLFEKAFQGQPFKPSAQLWNQILDAVRFVMDEERRKGKRESPLLFKYFRITTITTLDSGIEDVPANKWKYTGKEVVPLAYDAENTIGPMYEFKAGGLSEVVMWNDAEERNTGTYTGEGSAETSSDGLWTNHFTDGLLFGCFNNGVFISELPEGMEIRAIPQGRVVRAYYTLVAGGAEWRFSEPNGIGGGCDPPEEPPA